MPEMREKELTPVRDPSHDELEEHLALHFRDEIYLPLVEMLHGKKRVLNTMDDLLLAIQNGRITFDRGRFSGRFSASTSRELKKLGAKWNKGSWVLPSSELPVDVKNAIAAGVVRFQQTMEKIQWRLRKILPEQVAEKFDATKLFDRTLYKVDRSLEKTMSNISVKPQLTPQRREKIAAEYTNNMRLYIQEWTEKEIVELRKKMEAATFAGDRYEGMIKVIQERYGVSKNKAKFLARQETNLLVAKFKAARYTENGIRYYKWRSVVGSPNHPVRPMHKKLNDESLAGKLFRFDDPPITTEPGESQRRNNPGEDFNCRCTAIPVVKF